VRLYGEYGIQNDLREDPETEKYRPESSTKPKRRWRSSTPIRSRGGHTLVVPKEPYEHLQDLPADLSADLFETVHEITPAIEEAVDADGTTIGINNGEAAGQEVPHVHVHIIPRFEGDDSGPIHAIAIDSPDLSEAELDEIAATIDA